MDSLLLGLLIIFIYFTPSLVASSRKHHNRVAIYVVNLFLGWTFIGWVVSLAWALTKVEFKQ